MAIPDRAPDGQFNSMNEWINYATRWIGGTNPLCADAKDRVCTIGKHFQTAHDEGTYPIRFWYDAGPQTAKEKKTSQKRAREILKANYPWRY